MKTDTASKSERFTWLEWGKHSHERGGGQGNEVRLGETEYLWLEKGLRSIGLFSKLTLRNLASILPYMRLYSHPKDAVLCREGELGDRFFLIYKGNVDILKARGIFEGSPIRLARLKAGDFLGEMALLFHQPRSATCVTAGPARIFELRYSDFDRVLKKHPEMLGKLRKVATTRMKQLTTLWSH
jgi:CRP-like cAMP-binding protein